MDSATGPATLASAAPSGAVVRSAAIAATGGLLFGFDTVVISGANDSLQRAYDLDANRLGFTVALALIGTVIGSFAIGPPADRFGRKPTFFALAIGYLASALGCAFAGNWYVFLASRLVGGLAIGGASVVAPLYIAEIAPSRWRGRLVGLNQLNVVTGILLAFVSNYAIARYLSPEVAWRWMLGVVAVPSLVFFLLLFLIPESPRWLMTRGRRGDAAKVLEGLGEPGVEAELDAIRASLPAASATAMARERLFQPRYARAAFLAWAVAMFNQLSGINALMYYAPTIFEMAGSERSQALLQSVGLGLINLLFTLAAMTIIDRAGRRPLILVGSIGTAACLGVVSWQLGRAGGANGSVVLAALLGFQAFFAFSQGAVIWVFISEIFPNAVRAKGQALGSFTHWFMAAAVSWSFPVVVEHSIALPFAFFAAMMVLQAAFAWTLMPETKGGTLEDIEQRLGAAPPAP